MLPSGGVGAPRGARSSERSALWQIGRWGAPSAAPVAVVCASGTRAAIAASVLRSRLPQPVLRVDGGVADVLAALVHEPAASLL